MMNTVEQIAELNEIPREKILSFTGHRPEKLPKDQKQHELLLQTLYNYIDLMLEEGYTVFLTGMADGIDYSAAEYLFRKREEFPNIRVIGIQPFYRYEAFFLKRHYDLEHLRHMQELCDAVICLEENDDELTGRQDKLFQNRNKFLVDHSSAIIAVCSRGGRSGSMQTVNYAKTQNIRIYRIEANPKLLYTPTPEQWPVEKINL